MRIIHTHRDLGLRSAKLAIVGGWVIIVLAVLVASIPANVLMPTARDRNRLRLVMPEGWAFFTKDAQEADVYLYRETNSGALSRIDGRAYRNVPLAGVDRRGRVQRGAASSLAAPLGPDLWTDCRGDVAACARSLTAPPVRLSEAPRLLDTCGSLILEKRKPAPWMWYRRNPQFQMPSQIAKVVVPC